MSAEVCGTTRCSGCRELALLAENERLRAALAAVERVLDPMIWYEDNSPDGVLDAVRRAIDEPDVLQ